MPQASVELLFTAAAVVLPLPLASSVTVRFWQLAIGAVLSKTVTVAVQVAVLLLGSVTVSVTVFAPLFEQVKSVWLSDRLTPQASVELLFTAAAVVLPLPVASSVTVTFWQMATGAVLSMTVTVAVQVAVLLLGSVTVSVTVLAPLLEQVKEVWLSDRLTPQASEDPLFTAAAVVLPLPPASKVTVTFWQLATGAVLSITVTVAVQVEALLLPSVAVRVTVFAPLLEQVKAVWLSDKLTLQASEEPLFTAAAVVLPLPAASKVTVTFWQIANGAVASVTVTVAVHEEVFPPSSVTVRVTVFVPRFEQVKVFGLSDRLKLPSQISEDPLFTIAASRVPDPAAFNVTVAF
jgi:hypothetical protein